MTSLLDTADRVWALAWELDAARGDTSASEWVWRRLWRTDDVPLEELERMARALEAQVERVGKGAA